MRKYTQKELKHFVELNMAEDLTNKSTEEIKQIKEQEKYLEQVGYSGGIYGINGALYKGYNTGKTYVIYSRNTNLMYLS